MTQPRTVGDLIANLSALNPDMEVACIEDLDIAGSGVDLRTVAGFAVSATGPIGGGERVDTRRVLVLVPHGGAQALRIAASEPWWAWGTRYSGDAQDEHVECRRCHAHGDREDAVCPSCGFTGGAP